MYAYMYVYTCVYVYIYIFIQTYVYVRALVGNRQTQRLYGQLRLGVCTQEPTHSEQELTAEGSKYLPQGSKNLELGGSWPLTTGLTTPLIVSLSGLI